MLSSYETLWKLATASLWLSDAREIRGLGGDATSIPTYVFFTDCKSNERLSGKNVPCRVPLSVRWLTFGEKAYEKDSALDFGSEVPSN